MNRKLTDSEIRNHRVDAKRASYKLTDGGGLYLLVNQKGKYWRYNYRINNKYKTLALGVYPEITLKEVRVLHEEAHTKVKQSIDPSVHRKIEKLKQQELADNTFEHIAREWFEEFKQTWVESHSKRLISRLENDVFPWLGSMPIQEIEPPEILAVMRRVQARGALESAHRVKTICGQVFRYAIATGRASRDQTADLQR